jgi:DNA-binding NarL/FixJ family response regulator
MTVRNWFTDTAVVGAYGCISLMEEQTASMKVPARASAARRGQRMRALIVGRDPRLLARLRRLERTAGIKIVGECASGWEALDLVERIKPDLVLSDFEIEDMTGAAIAKALKARRWSPLVVLTSLHDSPLYAEISSKAGADMYVPARRLRDISLLLAKLGL